MRPSTKAMVWAGDAECYRLQHNILIDEAAATLACNQAARLRALRGTDKQNSVHYVDRQRMLDTSKERGGVTPFNCLPVGTDNARGRKGHSAGTPLAIADWWVRYICPPGGVVLDPFSGSGTMGVAALQNNCSYIGIDKMKKYDDIAYERLSEVCA